MKVLFVNPYIYDFTAYDLWLRPLGLLYLAAVVKKYTDCQIFWIDVLDRFQPLKVNQTIQKPENVYESPKSKTDGRGKFHREILEKSALYQQIPRNYSRYGIPVFDFKDKLVQFPEVDYIFVTTLMTYWNDGINFTTRILRDKFPKAQIIVGGILPTLLGKEINQFIKADYYISGYGENQILDYLHKQGMNIFSYPDLANLENIPAPAFEYLSNKKILPLLTSRGCPFNCSYCVSQKLNNGFQERSVHGVVTEINTMSQKYSPEHFVIFDDALLVNKENHFFKIFSALDIKTKPHFHTPNGLHAKEIDLKTAKILYNSRFKTVRLGFESLKPDILANSSDKINESEMKKAITNLEKAGYKRKQIEAYLLFGYPGQTVSDLEETLFFVRDLGIIPRLALFSPVPGSKDFLKLQKKGIISRKINLYETNKTYFLYQKSGFTENQIQYINDLTKQIVQQNTKQI